MIALLTLIHKVGKPSALFWLDAGSKDKAKGRFLDRRREDSDNAEKFETRYAQYDRENKPIMDWYNAVVQRVSTGAFVPTRILISCRSTPDVPRKSRIEPCTTL